MSTLPVARQDLVNLKVQLYSSKNVYAQMVEANPSANTMAIQATIASLESQIATQSLLVRTLSGMQNNYAFTFTPISSDQNLVLNDLSVLGNITAVNTTVSGNLHVNGAIWASSVIYETTTPFTYTGPGASYDNGVPFFTQVATQGTSFVTASGNNNSVFTFAATGTYMVQSEVEVSYPWMPEGVENKTYYVVNGDATVPYGTEVHASTNFTCTRPVLLTLNANDNVRFVIEASTGYDYEVGLDSTKLTILKLG